MTAIKASERGAYEYLPKPFDLRELVSIVGRALAEPKRRREEADDHAAGRGHADRRPVAGDAGHLSGARPAHADRSDGDDLGRIRHRQGTRRARPARLRQAQGRPVRRHQHGRHSARSYRERTLRPRKGGLHRRRRAIGRAVRAGGGRNPIPRRNRRHADGGADSAPSGPPGGRIHDRRRPDADQDQRPHRRRDQQGPPLRHSAGGVPRGPVLPPERRSDPPAAAARAARGHPRPRARLLPARRRPKAADEIVSSRRRSSG